VIPPEQMATIRISAAERCLQEYEEYLCDIQALARSTIIHYLPFVREFLKHRFGDGKGTLSKLSAADVLRFVQIQAPRLHLKQAKLMTTVLRSFLRYVRYRGDIMLDKANKRCAKDPALMAFLRSL
jgi:integrase/recombinase XerD